MIFTLLLFFIILQMNVKKNSVSYILVLLYIVTLCANFLIGTDLGMHGFCDVLYVIWTAVVLSFLFMPWSSYEPINSFAICNERALMRFVYVVGALCLFMTIGCAAIAYAVNLVVEDINVFKYRGEQQEVYASIGMSMKPYLLAYIFYPISYLFIPLIFYYLSRKKYGLMLICFFSSLSSVTFGLAYFSRSHTTQYVLLLLVSYWMFRNTLSCKLRKIIGKIGLILIILIGTSFFAISNSRFEDKDYVGQKSDAVIKNTVAYSLADYTGMWWYAGRDVFEDFQFETMNGKIALQGVNRALNMLTLGLIPSNVEKNAIKREKLLKENSGGFIGVSAYFLYDTGVIISLIILLVYFNLVRKNRPKNSVMTPTQAMLFIILIMLPLFGIFYSTLDVIILLLLYYLPIKKILL